MHPTLSIQALAQRPDLKPTVSAWLLSEWPEWYGAGGPGDLHGDIDAFARSESSLPIGLVVFDHEVPIGFATLKQESIPSHAHLSPWAATGFVLPAHRGRGVGAFLVQAVADRAKVMGHPHVYCGTSTAVSLLRRAGWREVERIVHAGKPLSIFQSAP